MFRTHCAPVTMRRVVVCDVRPGMRISEPEGTTPRPPTSLHDLALYTQQIAPEQAGAERAQMLGGSGVAQRASNYGTEQQHQLHARWAGRKRGRHATATAGGEADATEAHHEHERGRLPSYDADDATIGTWAPDDAEHDTGVESADDSEDGGDGAREDDGSGTAGSGAEGGEGARGAGGLGTHADAEILQSYVGGARARQRTMSHAERIAAYTTYDAASAYDARAQQTAGRALVAAHRRACGGGGGGGGTIGTTRPRRDSKLSSAYEDVMARLVEAAGGNCDLLREATSGLCRASHELTYAAPEVVAAELLSEAAAKLGAGDAPLHSTTAGFMRTHGADPQTHRRANGVSRARARSANARRRAPGRAAKLPVLCTVGMPSRETVVAVAAGAAIAERAAAATRVSSFIMLHTREIARVVTAIEDTATIATASALSVHPDRLAVATLLHMWPRSDLVRCAASVALRTEAARNPRVALGTLRELARQTGTPAHFSHTTPELPRSTAMHAAGDEASACTMASALLGAETVALFSALCASAIPALIAVRGSLQVANTPLSLRLSAVTEH